MGTSKTLVTKLKRKSIPEQYRNLDLDNIEDQVKTGLNDLRLKNMVMKDLKNEYTGYMETINEFLFVTESNSVKTDTFGNIVPVPIEPVTYDWLEDLKYVLDNTNDLFITIKNNPSVKEFDHEAVIREALGE